MPTLTQGRLGVLSFSLLLSCVAFGISLSLLNDPVNNSDDMSTGVSNGVTTDWRQPQPRDHAPQPPVFDAAGFRNVMILGITSSSLNMLLSSALFIVAAMKRNTIISAVAVEAPCIYIVSFLWLGTGGYAEHRVELGGYFPWLDAPQCTRYKVLEGIAFINWIQLMLYANTLMTVATICHVRGRRMWLQPTAALPTFAAPALTFAPKWDIEPDSPSKTKTNESQVPILSVSSQPMDSHNPSHFRSRVPFLPIRSSQTGISPADPSSSEPSDSTGSLARSVSAQSDVTPFHRVPSPQLSTPHQSVPIGEPPTYSGPGSNDEPFAP